MTLRYDVNPGSPPFRCDNCGNECDSRPVGPLRVPTEPRWLRLRVETWTWLESYERRRREQEFRDLGVEVAPRPALELDVCPECATALFSVIVGPRSTPGLSVLYEKWCDQ